jgi:hypothetical protein
MSYSETERARRAFVYSRRSPTEGGERDGSVRLEAEDQQTIRRYLLDDVAPEERRRLEERLLDDGDDFFDQLQLAEWELVDDYVTGNLSEAERARFREAFLSTSERHEQLRFAELLRSHFADAPLKKSVTDEEGAPSSWLRKLARLFSPERPAVGFALACALVLAVCVAAAAGFRAWRLGRRLDELQARQSPASAVDQARLEQQLAEERSRREAAAQGLSREQERRAALEDELARMRQGGEQGEAAAASTARPPAARQTAQARRGAASGILALALSSGGVTRDLGERKEARLGAGTKVVRLLLEVGDDDYQSFSAALEDADGKSLLVKDSLLPKTTRGGRTVTFDVLAKRLAGGGDFQLLLSGRTSQGNLEETGRYYFRVRRE